MNFVDRTHEMKRLDRFQAARRGGLAVVWGRRRIGKTRLLLEWCRKHDGLYTVPDQSAAGIQRRYFSEALARRFPGMADVEYPDWTALLNRVAQEAARASWRGPLVIAFRSWA